MSRKWIAILEDDLRRRVAMCKLLDDRLLNYPVVWFRSAFDMVDWLRTTEWNQILFFSLDHDLEDIADGNPELLCSAGTGQDVVDFLTSSNDDLCRAPIIVHTTNYFARVRMVESLREHGWTVLESPPYGDLQWVPDLWYPAVKEALRVAVGNL